MASNREDRFLMRQRGAGTHKIRDVDFGLSFPIPSRLQLAPRLSSASSRSARTSLPGESSGPVQRSDHATPENKLRRQRSDSTIAQQVEGSVVSQGSIDRRSTLDGRSTAGKTRLPGSSALRDSTRSFEGHPQLITPLNTRSQSGVVQGKGSDDDEDMPSIPARTPSSGLKRKRAVSPYGDIRSSHSRRLSRQPAHSMVDELDELNGPSPGLFLTPDDRWRTTRFKGWNPDAPGSGMAYAQEQELSALPSGRSHRQPGSSGTMRATQAEPDDWDIDEDHGSIGSRNETSDDRINNSALEEAEAGPDVADVDEVDELAEGAPIDAEQSRQDEISLPPRAPAPERNTHLEPRKRPSIPPVRPRSQPSNPSIRQQAAKNIRRTKGAQVLVYRLANTRGGGGAPGLPGNEGEEDDEDVLHTAPKFISRPGVNAVDVLAQVCKELVEARLHDLHERGSTETDPGKRAELRRHRKAVEAYGQELEARCFELTEALDNNHALSIRVRQATREKFTLREELLRLRREREALALKIEQVRRLEDERARADQRQNTINTTTHDIHLAVQRGLARKNHTHTQQQQTPTLNNLHIKLRSSLSLSTPPLPTTTTTTDNNSPPLQHKQHGLLATIKDFNDFLQRAVTVLEP